MSNNEKAEDFVQTFVLGFGFLGGAFLAIGVNPDPASIGIQILTILNSSFPNNNTANFIFILNIVSLIITAITLIVAWQMGRKLGFFCIGLAWVGGFMILKYSINQFYVQLGAILVIISVILGKYAVN
jgi:hypothetical protein